MHTFFHGWRRKAGCVKLIMAVAVFGMWMRSRVMFDWLTFATNLRGHWVCSYADSIWWISFPQDRSAWWLPFNSGDDSSLSLLSIPERATRAWVNVHFLLRQRNRPEVKRWKVRYWQIVISLTLLSAYLILWKPRKRA
mgnify:CR=1 FL=1